MRFGFLRFILWKMITKTVDGGNKPHRKTLFVTECTKAVLRINYVFLRTMFTFVCDEKHLLFHNVFWCTSIYYGIKVKAEMLLFLKQKSIWAYIFSLGTVKLEEIWCHWNTVVQLYCEWQRAFFISWHVECASFFILFFLYDSEKVNTDVRCSISSPPGQQVAAVQFVLFWEWGRRAGYWRVFDWLF